MSNTIRNRVKPTAEPQWCPWCGKERVKNGESCSQCGTSLPRECSRAHRVTLDDLKAHPTQAQIDAEYEGGAIEEDEELPILDDLGDEILKTKRRGKKR